MTLESTAPRRSIAPGYAMTLGAICAQVIHSERRPDTRSGLHIDGAAPDTRTRPATCSGSIGASCDFAGLAM